MQAKVHIDLVTFGDKTTVIKSGELTPLYVKIIKNNWGYEICNSDAFNFRFKNILIMARRPKYGIYLSSKTGI